MADATQARTDPTRHEALVAAERALVEAEEDLSAFLRWVGARRVTLRHVSSHPPFRAVLAAFVAYGSTPSVNL